MGGWIDYSLPKKKGNLGRPIIPIAIGPHIFQEVVCDFSASVNIMPKIIYDKVNRDTLLHTNMRSQYVDRSLCYPRELLKTSMYELDSRMYPQIFWFEKQVEM